MSARKRFASEDEIVKAIDTLQAKMMTECKEAEEKDTIADLLYKDTAKVMDPQSLIGPKLESYNRKLNVAKECRITADRLRSVQGTRKRQMEKLKQAWAEFKTEPMPFLGDHSVLL